MALQITSKSKDFWNALRQTKNRYPPMKLLRKLFTMISWKLLKFFTARSSRKEVFCKKGVLGNFAKFTGKHLCQSIFFNKVADLRTQVRKISKNTFFYRTPLVTASVRRLHGYHIKYFRKEINWCSLLPKLPK